MSEKIKFKDLSNWIKIAIIGGWIFMFTFILSFIIGFIQGIIA
jgi:hypothetical protein